MILNKQLYELMQSTEFELDLHDGILTDGVLAVLFNYEKIKKIMSILEKNSNILDPEDYEGLATLIRDTDLLHLIITKKEYDSILARMKKAIKNKDIEEAQEILGLDLTQQIDEQNPFIIQLSRNQYQISTTMEEEVYSSLCDKLIDIAEKPEIEIVDLRMPADEYEEYLKWKEENFKK